MKKKKQSQPNAALSPGISGINNQDLSILCATCYLYVRQKLTAVNGRPTFYVKYLHTPKLNKINTSYYLIQKVVTDLPSFGHSHNNNK